MLLDLEGTRASGRLEHLVSIVGPYGVGVRTWSVVVGLATPYILNFLWGRSLILQEVKNDRALHARPWEAI